MKKQSVQEKSNVTTTTREIAEKNGDFGHFRIETDITRTVNCGDKNCFDSAIKEIFDAVFTKKQTTCPGPLYDEILKSI